MKMDSEALYRNLEQIVASMPDLYQTGAPPFLETQRWLGRAAALVEQAGDLGDLVDFKQAVSSIGTQVPQPGKISTILFRALGRAELRAPASARGAFIPIGAPFDVFSVLTKILGEARNGVLFVDPYMDATVVTDFAALLPQGIPLHLLTDGQSTKWIASLTPAVNRWVAQYGAARPLEARQSVPGALHDRLVLMDGTSAWQMSQSLKGLRETGARKRFEIGSRDRS